MKTPLTEAEFKIMQVLWQSSPQTMRQLVDALESDTHWSKYTVITLLKRMQAKGTVTIDESGAVKRYSPAVEKQQIAQEQTQSLVSNLFSGKAALLVNQLVEDGISQDELAEMMDILRNASSQS